MSSESTEEESLTVHLPAELDDWLDEQAADSDVDRETLLIQLLTSYRKTAELADGSDGSARISDAGTIESAIAERLPEASEAMRDQLERRLDAVEADFEEKLDDVRERVIQVKQSADAKAPADHSHEEFDRFVTLANRLDELEDEVETLTERLEAVTERERDVGEIEERLDTVQDRLQTVAWVVGDLREAQESSGGMEAVDRIKRAAAKADVDRAQCENCGNGVELALLTDANCPHCNATVTDVEPSSGLFSKPQLLVASQLEPGDGE